TAQIRFAKSTDGGVTWSNPGTVASIVTWQPRDQPAASPAPDAPQVSEPGGGAQAVDGSFRDCGDFDSACSSGYTFFRADLPGPRSAADQSSDGRPGEPWAAW